jgi:hypothetical protein
MTDLARFDRYFRPGFLPWLADNESTYEQFERQAIELIKAGWTHFSARTILEEIRHYTRHEEKGNCSFKINDHMAPDLARVFVIRHPEYKAFWEYRRPDWRAFLAAVENGGPIQTEYAWRCSCGQVYALYLGQYGCPICASKAKARLTSIPKATQ